MKKYLVLLLAAALLACSACGKKQVVQSGTLGEEELVTASTAELVYKNESYTLRFNKNEAGDWQWKDDTTLPLDQQQMQQLLDQVSALNALTPLEATADSTAYDLDAPDRTLEIKNSDGTGLSLQIGAAIGAATATPPRSMWRRTLWCSSWIAISTSWCSCPRCRCCPWISSPTSRRRAAACLSP